jgi:hypothetical protein
MACIIDAFTNRIVKNILRPQQQTTNSNKFAAHSNAKTLLLRKCCTLWQAQNFYKGFKNEK